MAPRDQTEKPFEFVQTSLFGEPEIVRGKPKRNKRQGVERVDPPPAPKPTTEPRWKKAKRVLLRMMIGLWRAVRWVLRHGSEIKTAWWIGGLLVGLLAMGGAVSVTYWQGQIGPYKVKVNKILPAPETGWDGQLREEPKPTKRKPSEVP